MNNIVDVIVKLSRMQGQAIDRAQAEAINTAEASVAIERIAVRFLVFIVCSS